VNESLCVARQKKVVEMPLASNSTSSLSDIERILSWQLSVDNGQVKSLAENMPSTAVISKDIYQYNRTNKMYYLPSVPLQPC
jgi:hypothetical protein